MNPSGNKPAPHLRTLVWADSAQAPWLSAALVRGNLRAVAAGSPLVGRSAEVAAAFSAVGPTQDSADVQPVSDLRAAIASLDVDVIFLGDLGEFGNGDRDADDLGALESARARGVRIFSLEPVPGSLLQMETPRLIGQSEGEEPSLAESAGVVLGNRDRPEVSIASPGNVPLSGQAATLETQGGWASFCPPLRLSSRMRAAHDLIEQFGPVLTCVVECLGSPIHGTLGARVFDAADLMVSLMGHPETIDAAYVWPTRGRGVHPVPSDRLRGLDGNMTANLRFSDGRSGMIFASGRAGRWGRVVTLISERGRLRIDDEGFEWIGVDGETLDSSGMRAESSRAGAVAAADSGVLAVADHLSRSLDPRLAANIPSDYRAVLATTGAALLSARTGEAESPATILRMARGA